MLVPMCLARPARAWFFATLCTVSSVIGGLLGYLIGKLAFRWIEPWIMESSYAMVFEQAVSAFGHYGFWYILLAGFTPIPYKIFTISAGVVGMPVIAFLAGSLAGRGGRFFLVAGLIALGGERFAERLRAWVDVLGWLALFVVVLVFAVIKLSGNGS